MYGALRGGHGMDGIKGCGDRGDGVDSGYVLFPHTGQKDRVCMLMEERYRRC